VEEMKIGPFPLETGANDFERAQVDTFMIEGVDIGEIHTAILQHDNSGFGPGWHLNMLEVHAPSKTFNFHANCWLDKKTNACRVELQSGKPPSGSDKHRYKVTVNTSDIRAAGTDADVTIIIFGEKGDSGERTLDTSANNFERAMQDIFFLDIDDLGVLKTIRVSHNNKGFGPGWHLADVKIEKTTAAADDPPLAREAIFPYHDWLDLSTPPHQISVELFPDIDGDGIADVGRKVRKVKYHITVYTSDIRGAGTDASVFMELEGEKGTVGFTRLEASSKDFERGSVDTFQVQGSDIGKLTKIGVKTDNSGWGAAWHLQQVEIRSEATGELYVFPCNNWFDASNGDKKIERELLVGVGELKEGESPPAEGRAQYKVTVFTSDKSGAGTDANVFLSLKGPKAAFSERPLNTAKDNFRRGSEDVFFFEEAEVAEVSSAGEWAIDEVSIASDCSRLFADWHLSHLKVMHVASGVELVFLCDDWLTKKQDSRTWRRENPLPKEQALTLEEGSGGLFNYMLTVVTGDKYFGGTDSKIIFTLVGAEGKTWAPTLDQKRESFERGRTDKFTCAREEDLGELTGLRIGGVSDKWALDKVVVTNLQTNREWLFELFDWVAKEEVSLKPKVLKRGTESIAAGGEDGGGGAAAGGASSEAEYQFAFYTGDKYFAGTDALVSVELVGKDGKSGVIDMDKGKELFERKRKDVFNRVVGTDVGDVSELRVWHDAAGMGSDWYLDKVEVENIFSEKKWEISCASWIKGGGEAKAATFPVSKVIFDGLDAQALAEKTKAAQDKVAALRQKEAERKGLDSAPSSPQAKSPPKAAAATATDPASPPAPPPKDDSSPAGTSGGGEYTLFVTTGSALFDRGTDDPVSFEIIGSNGDLTLGPFTDQELFSSGKTDLLKGVAAEGEIGDLFQLRVLKPGGDNWLLETVRVRHESSGRETTFHCGAKLTSKYTELRVMADAPASSKVEEWMEATTEHPSDGELVSYWWDGGSKSVWEEPPKYFCMQFTLS